MTNEAAALAILNGNSTVVNLCPGGRYASQSLPRLGITPKTKPIVFDGPDGRIQRFLVIKERQAIATVDVKDQSAKLSSYRQVLEVWMYDDGDAGYTTLTTLKNKVYELLQHEKLTGTPALEWSLTDQGYAPEYNDAGMMRLEFEIIALKRAG